MGMMIGDTASITLLTALPGSGKTLRLVKFIKEAGERGELVFACNVNGLKVPHVPFEDPHNWRELPPGSVLVVDEAQKFFRTRRGGEAPEYITAMETIRHLGIRLVLATQQPDYLDAHLRGLVGLHEHLVREGGKSSSIIYRHHEVMENVRSERARSRYDKEVWTFPPELFPLYDSAEVHTVKKRWGSKFKKGVIYASLAAGLLLVAAWRMPSALGLDRADDQRAEESAAGDGSALPPVGGDAKKVAWTAETWAMRFHPRIPEMPMSAPAFDEREVVAEPRVACGIGETIGCRCYTEQGTRYEMPDDQCRTFVDKGGMYDPFKKPEIQPEQAPPVEPLKANEEAVFGEPRGLVQGIGSSADLAKAGGES